MNLRVGASREVSGACLAVVESASGRHDIRALAVETFEEWIDGGWRYHRRNQTWVARWGLPCIRASISGRARQGPTVNPRTSAAARWSWSNDSNTRAPLIRALARCNTSSARARCFAVIRRETRSASSIRR